MKKLLLLLFLLLLTGCSFGAKPVEPFVTVHQEGIKTWQIETDSLQLKKEFTTGIPHLDIQVKITFNNTTNYDWLQLLARTDKREWQPISTTGCDKDGNVIEL